MGPRAAPGKGRRRIARHILLGAASLGLIWVGEMTLAAGDPRTRVSLASAYVALGLLVITLLVGPLNVLGGRKNPVSTMLRRDLGIWAALVGLFHLVIGLSIHLRGRPWLYFVDEAGAPRGGRFGFANHTGLLAGLLLLLLLVLSNDLSLRRLGTARWKTLQRASYLIVLLTAAHGILYQLIEQRTAPYVALFSALLGVTALLQLAGAWRRRAASASADVTAHLETLR